MDETTPLLDGDSTASMTSTAIELQADEQKPAIFNAAIFSVAIALMLIISAGTQYITATTSRTDSLLSLLLR